MNALHSKVSLDHEGTHYVMHHVKLVTDESLICIETGWGSNYGQWILLPEREEISWNYLAEKMPGLREGDRPGYTLMLAKIGVEVF